MTVREKVFLGFGGMAVIMFVLILYIFQSLNVLKLFVEEDRDILLIQHNILLVAILVVSIAVGIAIGVTRIISKELQEMEEQKGEFVALASHQLRTPPTIVKYDSEYLLSGEAGKLTRTQKKYVEEIAHANQRMVDIIRALLNVSRMEMGTYSIRPEEVDVCAILKSVVGEFRPAVKAKQLKVTATCAKIPTIQADPRLVRIVLQSLIANAVKYTPAKGRMSIDVHVTESEAFIEIRDTGFGIPYDVQDKIFTKMFRADNARLHDPEGTGLGLYIAHSIIERVGGKMWFESTEGKGSTFYFSLPRKGMKEREGKTQLALS